MKKLNAKVFKYFLLLIFLLTASLLSLSAGQWLSKPNNFLYTVESEGQWSPRGSTNYKASGYNVKINALCAKEIYNQIENDISKNLNHLKPKIEDEQFDFNTLDFNRFLQNKSSDIEFQTSEISYISLFKWYKNNYITYKDPTLKNGIRFSFANKCLYEKDCLLTDSLDYLFIKIGIKYFLSNSQSEYLKNNCIENQKVFYKINRKYNMGRSHLYYRNGIGIWMGIWYNLLGLAVLLLAAGGLVFIIYRKRRRKNNS